MLALRRLLVLVVCVAPALAQGGGIRGPATAVVGGSIAVQVANNVASIELVVVAAGSTQTVPVGPGKTTTVPVPNVAPGSVLLLLAGRPGQRSVLVVEVVSP